MPGTEAVLCHRNVIHFVTVQTDETLRSKNLADRQYTSNIRYSIQIYVYQLLREQGWIGDAFDDVTNSFDRSTQCVIIMGVMFAYF